MRSCLYCYLCQRFRVFFRKYPTLKNTENGTFYVDSIRANPFQWLILIKTKISHFATWWGILCEL